MWLTRSKNMKYKKESETQQPVAEESIKTKASSPGTNTKGMSSIGTSPRTSTGGNIINEHARHQRETLRRALVKADSIRSLISKTCSETGGGSYVSLGQYFSDEVEGLDCSDSMAVIKSWDSLKHQPNIPTILGEQVILKLMELDSRSREKLGFESVLDSKRFIEISRTIVAVVESVVGALGPDLDEFVDELPAIHSKLKRQGFDDSLLSSFSCAVSQGVCATVAVTSKTNPQKETVVYQEETEMAWKSVFDFVIQKKPMRR